ncbi:hypothetical protein J2795_002917 [Chryseobacterium bernardetii]|jgi:hypothetical protein|uniref:Uncharacterized protein n=2 Tax=Chryseobacterium TaxID=59732 RepID=A0A543EBW4_9FLAO|nr:MULTISPECIES: hypothetical protein [Chryseobacterium]MDR6371296.1 hypothetical protein [Chryseobacterium vietnamense]MDR6442199.1 hypothetical protein [Chryseobacterium bernardetii]TQM19077.1 hypothetical protein FB551_3472 [Chryseobacterium aquifrigidense]
MFKKLFIIITIFSVWQSLFCQTIENNCPKNLTYFASTIPIDGDKWYAPIKYNIQNGIIDLKIIHKEKEELFIRFKIIENLICDFKNMNNCNLKYKVLTYDEETDLYEQRISEIEFKFFDGKGKIYIKHPNFTQIVSDATSINEN